MMFYNCFLHLDSETEGPKGDGALKGTGALFGHRFPPILPVFISVGPPSTFAS